MMLRYAGLVAVLALSLGIAAPAIAQNADDPAEWMLGFLSRLNQNPDKAFQEFKADTYIGQTVGASTEQIRDAYKANRNSFGMSHSYELLLEQELGSRIKRVAAVLHHNKGAQLFTFDFYRHKPGDGWQLMAYRVDNNLQKFPWDSATSPAADRTVSRR